MLTLEGHEDSQTPSKAPCSHWPGKGTSHRSSAALASKEAREFPVHYASARKQRRGEKAEAGKTLLTHLPASFPGLQSCGGGTHSGRLEEKPK